LFRDDNVSAFCSHDNVGSPALNLAAKGPLQVYHLWDFRQPPAARAVLGGGVYIFPCVCAWPGELPNTGWRTGCLVADIKTNVGDTRVY
jgi:hypothetical protein